MADDPLTRAPGRPRDPDVTEAIIAATLRLLAEEGFARITMESVAKAAGVGKPAVYRRFPDKAALVVAAFASVMGDIEPPELGDTREELRALVANIAPPDPEAWVGFIGGLVAEARRHPEVVAAFREHVLLPRRATGRRVLERGRARGDVRTDVDVELLLDFLVGPSVAAVFAGRPLGPAYREATFELLWELVRAR